MASTKAIDNERRVIDNERRIKMSTLIDAAEPMVLEALRLYKQRTRTGVDLEALRALESVAAGIETWRVKGGPNG